jgi:putative ABC transport system permease protein
MAQHGLTSRPPTVRHVNGVALFDALRVGVDALRTNPLRTVLSTTGVVIGVAALVAAFAITDGVEVWSRELIMRQSSVQDVVVSPIATQDVNGRATQVRGYPVFQLEDAAAARHEIAGVTRQALSVNGTSHIEYGDRRVEVQLTASSASLADFADLRFADGRFFTETEAAHDAAVVVLGHSAAAALAGTRDPLWMVGRSIRMGGEAREVLGVLARPTAGPESYHVAFVPLRSRGSLFDAGTTPPAPTLRLKARSVEAVDSLRLATLDWLAERYGRRIEKLEVTVANEQLTNTREAMLLTKVLLGILVGLILAVGGIGIMNVLLAGIAERTREIGIRKAVGARAGDIHAQFLVESLTVTLLGAALGFVMGVIIAFGGTALFRYTIGSGIYPVVRPGTVALAVLSATAVGLIFGTYPARRAARLSPVEAISRE